MSPALIALFFGLGIAGFCYMQLAKYTGNASPSQSYYGAAIAGTVGFIFIYTLIKYVLHF